MADYVLKPATEIAEGDRLDLEGDPFADPGGTVPAYKYEWQEVHTAERETPDCVLLGGDNWLVGFPPDHLLKVRESDDA